MNAVSNPLTTTANLTLPTSTPRAVLSAVYPTYTVMAYTTMPAATPPGLTIDVILPSGVLNEHSGPAFNQAGQAAFICTLKDAAGNPAGKACMRANLTPPGLTLMASTLEIEPQPPYANFLSFESVDMNDFGTAAYGAQVGAGVDGIWAGNRGSRRQVARSGSPSPDAAGNLTGALFQSFSPPAINNYGRVAFKASLGAGVTGVWYEDRNTGALRRLARSGDPAPYLGPNAKTFVSFPENIVYNDQGCVAFLATLNGAWTYGAVHALYVSAQPLDWDPLVPPLYVIAQEGEDIPGLSTMYTCQFLRVRPHGICRGSSMLSNNGSITFAAGKPIPHNDVVIVARFPY